MTHEKAREFFSAYREGSLDAALRSALARRFAEDAELRAEYASFEATFDRLGSLREIQAAPPADLAERIAARLDRHVWERKQAAPPAWSVWLRNAALAGAAVLVLGSAVISLRRQGGGPAAAGLVQGFDGDRLAVAVRRDALTVIYSPASPTQVVFRSEPSGRSFLQAKADRSNPLSWPIDNPNPATALVSIELLDRPQSDWIEVAVPGTRPEAAKSGNGTLEEFARALAARYRVPVVLQGVDSHAAVAWNLNPLEARQAADAALKGQFSVDQRDGNLITVSP